MAKGQPPLLPPEEEQHLRDLAASGTETLQRRAQVILDWHDCLAAADTAKRLHLTENQVRYLLRLYREKGLELFVIEAEPDSQPAQIPARKAARQAAAPPITEAEGSGEITLETLCANYQVDMRHAR